MIVYLQVDVQEAMGANILNNMLEAVKDDLEELSKGQALMGILPTMQRSHWSPPNAILPSLVWLPALPLLKKLLKNSPASKLAQVDPYRCDT